MGTTFTTLFFFSTFDIYIYLGSFESVFSLLLIIFTKIKKKRFNNDKVRGTLTDIHSSKQFSNVLLQETQFLHKIYYTHSHTHETYYCYANYNNNCIHKE